MKRKGVIKEICHGYYPLIPINSGNAEPAFVTASSAASPSAPPAASASKSVISLIDYKDVDYRGFVFVVHGTHGLLLLHCTRKKKKGSHYQLPGGHVDDNEFESSARICGEDPKTQLLSAGKAGAARELWEETGIDMRQNLERLLPAALRQSDTETMLSCELKKRVYFFLSVDDSDFWTKEITDIATISRLRLKKPLGHVGSNLMLKLSTEHSGFTFEKDPAKSVQLLKAHSGGKGSQALLMAMSRNVIGVTAPAQASDNIETPTQALLVSGLLDDKKICPDIKADKCQTTEQKEEKPIESTAADIVTEKKGPLNLISKPKKETGLFACFPAVDDFVLIIWQRESYLIQ